MAGFVVLFRISNSWTSVIPYLFLSAVTQAGFVLTLFAVAFKDIIYETMEEFREYVMGLAIQDKIFEENLKAFAKSTQAFVVTSVLVIFIAYSLNVLPSLSGDSDVNIYVWLIDNYYPSYAGFFMKMLGVITLYLGKY
uniref:Uncharacterized protein LOC114343464 n=1 Tax=Diabrotica virgifera virgifera TaxID=50390 RepID=A0A6P7GJK3_DIAVI